MAHDDTQLHVKLTYFQAKFYFILSFSGNKYGSGNLKKYKNNSKSYQQI